jgi:large subunit ribosomal protein L6e
MSSVTGPFKVNGVPLRRVNQNYVISTSTKLDLGSADLTKYNDVYFKKEVVKTKKGESEFFEAEKEVSFDLNFESKSPRLLTFRILM